MPRMASNSAAAWAIFFGQTLPSALSLTPPPQPAPIKGVGEFLGSYNFLLPPCGGGLRRGVSSAMFLIRHRCCFVHVDAESTGDDLLAALGDHLLDVRRQLGIPGMERRKVGAALAHVGE